MIAKLTRNSEQHNPAQLCLPARDVDDEEQREDMWEDFVTSADGESNLKDVKLSTGKTIDVPAMPCSESPVNLPHQPHHGAHPLVHYAMVARSVGKQEATTQPKAIAAIKSDRSNMHKKV